MTDSTTTAALVPATITVVEGPVWWADVADQAEAEARQAIYEAALTAALEAAYPESDVTLDVSAPSGATRRIVLDYASEVEMTVRQVDAIEEAVREMAGRAYETACEAETETETRTWRAVCWLEGDYDRWCEAPPLPRGISSASPPDPTSCGGWLEGFDVDAASPAEARRIIVAWLDAEGIASLADYRADVAIEVEGEEVSEALEARRRLAWRYASHAS